VGKALGLGFWLGRSLLQEAGIVRYLGATRWIVPPAIPGYFTLKVQTFARSEKGGLDLVAGFVFG
jgi:hypothetical protein